MKTIQNLKNIVSMQYIMEALIESYNEAQAESDKYYIKLNFLECLEASEVDLEDLYNYMKLQEDKFMPFICLLKQIQLTSNSSSKVSTSSIKNPIKVKMYAFNIGDL